MLTYKVAEQILADWIDTMNNFFGNRIESIDDFNALRAELGQPSSVVNNKVIYSLDSYSKEFISKSPFIVIATSGDQGSCDASPRGDRAGFVHVIDEKHLFIPERPGNRRMDSIQNILHNPQIGIIFIIPGMEETFRVNGKACISRDEALLAATAVNGKLPALGIGVEIEECYMHCGKAFKRSNLWNAEQWLPKSDLPSASKIIAAHVSSKMQVTEEQIQSGLEDTYKHRLY